MQARCVSLKKSTTDKTKQQTSLADDLARKELLHDLRVTNHGWHWQKKSTSSPIFAATGGVIVSSSKNSSLAPSQKINVL